MKSVVWILCEASFGAPTESAVRFEYLATVATVLVVGLALIGVYRAYWHKQMKRVAEMGLHGVALVSEATRWGEALEAWAREEGLALTLPATAVVGSNKYGIGLWKDSHSEVIKIPASSVETITADGGTVVVVFGSTRGDARFELRFRPRTATIAGFPAMRPEKVSDVVEELKNGLSKSAT